MVAIDIETTGLDQNKDAITEIAAVRFSGHRVEAEWTKLVNPGRPIPPMITQLTGISNEMVRNAPPIQAVIKELADFVGDDPVVGHNVRFDLGFLQKHRILQYNKVVDTYELASIILPSNSRYNLGTLGSTLGSLIPNSHRALDDARLTHAVLHALYQKLLELPIEFLAETVRLGENIDWDGALMF
ncbi:MAG: 3'-5' exonuclease, partial [Anaerolineaceae bacterium]|nr:3'-5' exonuclease [Anaerolineaceae bacterium]